MITIFKSCAIFLCASLVSSCGVTVTPLPEAWDLIDSSSTYKMEYQVKRAIWCELKKAAADVRRMKPLIRLNNAGREISTIEDGYLPDSWGVLIQLTIQAGEKSSLTPGVLFKNPLINDQSFTFGIGGEISSENQRFDKYDFYYSARQLATPISPNGSCRDDFIAGEESASSPFLNASNMGIRDWLTTAVRVINFQRSSREAINGQGPPLASDDATSDAATYSNKFTIVTSANISPVWELVRIGTAGSPLFDLNRTRVHELIMTVGPSERSFKISKSSGKSIMQDGGLSQIARDSHNAALIGSAVANAIRTR